MDKGNVSHSGLHYNERTPTEVIVVLDNAYNRGTRLCIVYGDTTSGEAWDAGLAVKQDREYGRVSRSGGEKPIPILIHNRRCIGGSAIITTAIVEIRESNGGNVLYKMEKKKTRCEHKPTGFLHWCEPCAEAYAGPKPECEFRHGDVVEDRDGDRRRVFDSEMSVHGAATATPAWREYLTFDDEGGGSVSLFKKISSEEKLCYTVIGSVNGRHMSTDVFRTRKGAEAAMGEASRDNYCSTRGYIFSIEEKPLKD